MSLEKEELQFKMDCLNLRIDIFNMLYSAGSGHLGGSLSSVEILVYLYSKLLKYEKNNPNNKDRDRFILSKGHGAPAYYAAMARIAGFFNFEDKCLSLRKLGACTQGHPDMLRLAGVDFSTGSLGQGFAVACGMATALKVKKSPFKVFTLVGDGELQEGIVWEASREAAHRKLDNLIAIVDNNALDISGRVKIQSNIEPIADKFRAFNWNVVDRLSNQTAIDGHRFYDLKEAFNLAMNNQSKPTIILTNTIKGKGFPPYEDDAAYHGVAPKENEYTVAMELFSLYKNIYEQKLKKIS